jgi:hypothetical protein
MQSIRRPVAYWVIVVFLALSILEMLMGQTTAVFNYDLAVRFGLQESTAQVGDYGVQVNRAFGAGDTVVYIPLMVLSLVGLVLRKRWSLMTTAAAVGVSAYWSVTIGSMLVFLPGVSGYSLVPGPAYWLFIGAYMIFGVWGLFYLMFRGDAMLR